MAIDKQNRGYRIDLERVNWLDQRGYDPGAMLKASEQFPPFNPNTDPLDIVSVRDQGSIGACQGFAVAKCFEICYWRSTGRIETFSALGAYILSQAIDGIRGDNGSTLSGGQRMAMQHGLCLESEWPYEGDYDPREPKPKPKYEYFLRTSKPIKDIGMVMEWLSAGLPIQWGLNWGNEMKRETVDSFTGRSGGGHSVVTWLLRDKDTANCINSWGDDWMGDGLSGWTRKAMASMLRHPYTVAIGYSPAKMGTPNLPPI